MEQVRDNNIDKNINPTGSKALHSKAANSHAGVRYAASNANTTIEDETRNEEEEGPSPVKDMS